MGCCILFGCGDSPSAVERLEQAPGALVTVSGTIDIGSPGAEEELPEIYLRFYEPPDTTLLEERQLLWTGSYRLEFGHDLVCGWSVDVTIWDGRRSERKPVAPNAPSPCSGLIAGPTFWFP
ncbi:MAG: hypothetical protein HKO77_00255 [Gemmatimonadetes bacterium]|nr:hypothetical protein [Gemmatimonadota bacterium]